MEVKERGCAVGAVAGEGLRGAEKMSEDGRAEKMQEWNRRKEGQLAGQHRGCNAGIRIARGRLGPRTFLRAWKGVTGKKQQTRKIHSRKEITTTRGKQRKKV